MKKKVCTVCKGSKILSSFPKHKGGKDGLRAHCRNCATKLVRAQREADPRLEMYWAAKRRARVRGLRFSITTENLFIPERCPILGILLQKGVGRGKVLDSSPSLDQIIPGLGYTPLNVQVISNKANAMKNNASLEELILLGTWAKRELDTRT